MRKVARKTTLGALRYAARAVLLMWVALAAQAGGEDPYPEFTASYDVRINGIKVGYANFNLKHLQADEYLYHSEAGTTGMVKLLGADTSTESSRWRYVDKRIQVLEYKAQREKGDDDDNANLVFDWQKLSVANRGAGDHWEIAMPEGTLDPMVMQLAMLFDLRDGLRVFKYPVAVRGRIKHYHFEVAGSDMTTLPFGNYRTVKLARQDDKRDQSWVWSAPELDYFPVRFVKQKGNGVKTEILLRELNFKPVVNRADATP